MGITVSVCEQATSGGRSGEVSLEFLEESVTLRELIRRYVYENVRERNARDLNISATSPGQVRRRTQARPLLDWEPEFNRALASFTARGFLVLVDDRQTTDLDEEVQLRCGSQITFLRLVPLVGG